MATLIMKQDKIQVKGKDGEKHEVDVQIPVVESGPKDKPETIFKVMLQAAENLGVKGETPNEKVLAVFNYSLDVRMRSKGRQAFVGSRRSPEKAVARAQKAIEAALRAMTASGMSEAEARKRLHM